MPGSGKSTAMNNVFGCSLDNACPVLSALKATSVTTGNLQIRVVKDKKEEKVEFTLQIIDTPGVGANIPKETIIKDMQDCVAEEEYTLIYCFSVAPGNVAQEINTSYCEKYVLVNGKRGLEQVHNSVTLQ